MSETDLQHRHVGEQMMFRGTVNQSTVYPREVVKEALARNASAVILAHNHPSGQGMPSEADRVLTAALARILGLVDVQVLDHFIVTGDDVCSIENAEWRAAHS